MHDPDINNIKALKRLTICNPADLSPVPIGHLLIDNVSVCTQYIPLIIKGFY